MNGMSSGGESAFSRTATLAVIAIASRTAGSTRADRVGVPKERSEFYASDAMCGSNCIICQVRWPGRCRAVQVPGVDGRELRDGLLNLKQDEKAGFPVSGRCVFVGAICRRRVMSESAAEDSR